VLSYLPLAHVFERAWSSARRSSRRHVYFAEALDTFVPTCSARGPTLFISVPRLWLKFQQGVLSKMPPQEARPLLKIPILGKHRGKKVLLGGLGLDQVRLAGSGSAPIPPELIAGTAASA
jgi:long-chain acyl-CoA synthetase